ncbi:MAG: GNAT family N-acetyltransferase [Tidjanibacter sp.]|nr:GNAT family N-acetyltransferase [Tidjanibacter sp.]
MKSSELMVVVRRATSVDAEIIAQAVAMAIGDESALRAYCGDDYLAVLGEIAYRKGTQYSWERALVAEVNGVVAGAIVGYDGAELQQLREGTFEVLRELVGRTPNIVDETEAGEYYLDSVGILPQFRGLGVGRKLVDSFCQKVFEEGHRCVGLIVDFANPTAESLYASLGFVRKNPCTFFHHQMWHLQREA